MDRIMSWKSRPYRRGLPVLLAGLLGVVLVLGAPVPLAAQIPLPSPSISQDLNRLPTRVQRYGAIEVAPVVFEGETLFKVVAPTVRDRSKPGSSISVDERAEEINANLKRVLAEDQPEEIQRQRGYATSFDPKSLQVFTATTKGATVIVAKDKYRSQLLKLATVTSLDADYYGLTIEELSQQWQAILYKKLSKALEARLPEKIERKIHWAIAIGLATVLGSLLLWLMQRVLQARDQHLKDRQAAAQPEPPPAALPTSAPAPAETTLSYQGRMVAGLRRRFTLRQRRNVLAAFRWLVSWGQIAVWLLGVALILQQFPYTRQYGLNLLGAPILLLVIWFISGLINWLGDLLIDRLGHVWENNQFTAFQLFAVEDAQRRSLRISTTVKALKGLKTFIVFLIGSGWALQVIGMPIASVLAGGALVAFAISLGFQNLIKDLVNGCLILWEDQYGIGDVIAINGSTGFVEDMNLRITQLRDAEGRLITIPNSSITKVENLTRTWSRVDFSLEVDYDTDINRVLQVIGEVAQQMYQETDWRDRILDAPEILGVDRLSHEGMLIRVWIKTKPLQQWPVGREFRRRVRLALAAHHIHIGTPQQTLRAEDRLLLPERGRVDHDGQHNTPEPHSSRS